MLKLGANLFNFQFCLLPSITLQIKKKSCIAIKIYSKLERRGCLQILKIIAALISTHGSLALSLTNGETPRAPLMVLQRWAVSGGPVVRLFYNDVFSQQHIIKQMISVV